MEKVIQITPSLRVIAEYSEEPYYTDIARHISDIGLAIQSIRQAHGIITYKTDTDYSSDIAELIEDNLGDYTEQENAIKAYLTNAELPFVFSTLKGFSQGEWSDVVVYDPNNVWSVEELNGVIENITAMYQGEAYEVSVQKAKVFYASDGATKTEWIEDENYDSQVIVESLFELTPEFVKRNYNLEVVPEVEG